MQRLYSDLIKATKKQYYYASQMIEVLRFWFPLKVLYLGINDEESSQSDSSSLNKDVIITSYFLAEVW